VSVSRRADEPAAFAHAVLSLRFSLNEYDGEECRQLFEEAQQLAEEADLIALAETASSSLAMQYLRDGRIDQALRSRRRSGELTDALNANAYTLDTTVALLRGDLVEADRCNERTGAALPEQYHHLYAGFSQLVIDAVRGRARPRALEPFVEVDSFMGSGTRAGLAYLLLVDGEVARPESMLADEQARGLAEIANIPWASGTLGMWAQVAAAVGNCDAARDLVVLLDPLAGNFATLGPIFVDTVDLARGLLQTTLGNHDAAISILAGAVAASRERGTVLPLGRELVALAAAHAAADDGTPIEPFVTEAVDIAERTGAAIIEADIALRLGPAHRLPQSSSPDDAPW
jgi:tetratricopeptide (TPR) repeat protein